MLKKFKTVISEIFQERSTHILFVYYLSFMQTTSKVLMVRPVRFGFNEETAQNNYFQQKSFCGSVAELALKEFDTFVNLLRGKDVDVWAVQDTPEPWTPDSIFPNNWFSSHITGELVLYPMFAKNRREERKAAAMDILLRKINHRKVIDLTRWEEEHEFLEGTGSMIFDRDKRIAYCCRSQRSSEKVLRDFCSRMNYESVTFDAVDTGGKTIYHTNVMMSVGTQIAVVCTESIRNEKERRRVVSKLTATGKVIVDISLDQVAQFAGNMLEVKSRNGQPIMVMSETARKSLTTEQERTIATYNKILAVPIPAIESNGGGSARCMIAEIFY